MVMLEREKVNYLKINSSREKQLNQALLIWRAVQSLKKLPDKTFARLYNYNETKRTTLTNLKKKIITLRTTQKIL